MTDPTDLTALDRLCAVPFHDADAPLRAAILRQLADTELHAALAADAAADMAELRMYDLPNVTVALAADDAAALAGFLGGPVAHVSLPGRVLAAALAAEGRGLLVNPGRRSEMLLDAAALAWLGQALAIVPDAAEAAPRRLTQPRPDAVAALAEPLAQRLSDMAGRIAGAALVGADWPDGRQGHLLVVAGAGADDRPALAKALAELLAFLPEIAGGVDVTFEPLALPPGALRIEPAPPAPAPAPVRRDPDAPPRLKW
ncbi:hypothetical protein [Paracoccus endophyticus]|uniref:hypothetical protein n=1 Tax=Paracoccus endophyticus TaxID=2233774 RepID=UPI001F0CA602|nr:hypothetical protein [Paracoccus endophyticus]